MTTPTACSENATLRTRVREQEMALAEVLIERRQARTAMVLLQLEFDDAMQELERTRIALERRTGELEQTKTQLRRALNACRGAQKALQHLREATRRGTPASVRGADGA